MNEGFDAFGADLVEMPDTQGAASSGDGAVNTPSAVERSASACEARSVLEDPNSYGLSEDCEFEEDAVAKASALSSNFVSDHGRPQPWNANAYLGYDPKRRWASHPRDRTLKIEAVADEIVAAIKPRSHVFVEAGTGSGKTRAIVGLINEAIPGARTIFVAATVALVTEAGETLSSLCAEKSVVCRYHESQRESGRSLASVLVCTPKYLLVRSIQETGGILASGAADSYVLDGENMDKVTLHAVRKMILAIPGKRVLVEMAATPHARLRVLNYDKADVGETAEASVDDSVALGRVTRAIQGHTSRDLAASQGQEAAQEWMSDGERLFSLHLARTCGLWLP